MSNLINHGLSALMEACNYSKRMEDSNDSLIEAFESSIDDDIKDAVTGGNLDDTVEKDMDGEGVGDDDEIKKLVDKIPPADQDINEEISNLVESVIPSDLSEYL